MLVKQIVLLKYIVSGSMSLVTSLILELTEMLHIMIYNEKRILKTNSTRG
jgi:hypothetical protein